MLKVCRFYLHLHYKWIHKHIGVFRDLNLRLLTGPSNVHTIMLSRIMPLLLSVCPYTNNSSGYSDNLQWIQKLNVSKDEYCFDITYRLDVLLEFSLFASYIFLYEHNLNNEKNIRKANNDKKYSFTLRQNLILVRRRQKQLPPAN